VVIHIAYGYSLPFEKVCYKQYKSVFFGKSDSSRQGKKKTALGTCPKGFPLGPEHYCCRESKHLKRFLLDSRVPLLCRYEVL